MSLTLPSYVQRTGDAWRAGTRWLAARMPKGLYARSLLIVILPVVLLQGVIVYFFMERHWQQVTLRMSSSVVAEIASIIDLYEANPQTFEQLDRVAVKRLGLDIDLLPRQPLPPAVDKPFFSILDTYLSRELTRQIARPFWIDTVGRSNLIEIRIQVENGVLRIITHRNQAYASNSHIFIVWMVIASLVLLAVAVAFLRNQIRPILRLARAAEDFGKGRDTNFAPHGAREVRQAGHAFLEMRDRIERTIDQRTAMLNGVSHDLRTILTRFKLSLAMLPEGPELEELQGDVVEMQRMLEAYLDFARGSAGEAAEDTDIRELLEQLRLDAERHGHPTSVKFSGDSIVRVRPHSLKRLLANLVGNAQRYGKTIAIDGSNADHFLTVHVDDDGPGIPANKRDDAFRPFVRLDASRNQDEGGTGLGLAIARDIARTHGGEIELSDSPLGGLRATISIPV
jgi:two-component system osmolarity sensor histidine kinase EnvZ